MVFKFPTFDPNGDFYNVNPGSPVCLTALSSASSSPRACSNCLGGISSSVPRSIAPAAPRLDETRQTQDRKRVGAMEAMSGQDSGETRYSEGTRSGSADDQVRIDYVATRRYRAPELCGSFFSKYTPAIDISSIGCIFAEVLTGKPLFPGKNVVHQLDLMTDLLGTPSLDSITRVQNDKARRYLTCMRKKQPMPFEMKFPNADPLALRLLERLLAFDPKDRPTAEEALADPYFKGLAKIEREPSCQPITKMEFEFERRRVTKEDIRELIFREILEYHPQLLKDYLSGNHQI